MKKRKWVIFSVLIVIILAVGGGFYWNMSHSVAKRLPGNTYRYQSVSKDKSLYVTFAENDNKIVVNQNKNTALAAAKSQSSFDKEYKLQSKEVTWNYKAEAGTLTLAQIKDNKVSQWQYNKILATSNKFTARSFTYQIAQAGQGQVKSKTVFEKVN
ncbi:hypothetical protein [Loigolactobacillus zhaoyuanensis]|uniref:Valyl-tRNA synthetase n=1 Tax=Loigolactobacillus zhaoyuanensis TaxID=2486017 RepID=A0ABW8UE04_9LACO|nr:hypothetical protein [Loigolactobacillus zhaoyuanensis]